MSTLGQVLSGEVISAIGWTLIGIIWQASLVAIALAIFLKLFRGQSARIKYYASLLSLGVIVAISVYNFTESYSTPTQKDVSENLTQMHQININDFIDQLKTSDEPITQLKVKLKDFAKQLDKYLLYIVNIWAIGIFVFMLKFLASYTYIKRLKQTKISNINEKWIQKFNEIEKRLSVSKKLKYLESGVVKVPMVLGYLKPVILIPAGMITGIPENQIEAIIAHELAHIKRNDYLVNILQTIVEIVFFFHPGVWYISGVIRTERENCCDDIALTVCDGNLTYAKALLSVQELYPGKVYGTVAFSGQKKQLLNRIKRMIMKTEIKSNLSDKIIATIIVSVGIIFATVSLNLKAEPSEASPILDNKVINSPAYIFTEQVTPQKLADIKKVVTKDTMKLKHRGERIDIDNNMVIKTFIDRDGKNKEMKFTLKNGSVSELFVDGKKIPSKDYPTYQPEIDKTITDLRDAKEDIRKAMQDIKDIDFDKIRKDVQVAMSDVRINMDSIRNEINRSIEKSKKVDIEKIMKEVEMNLKHFERINIDSLVGEITIDIEGIRRVNTEEFKKQMEEIAMLNKEQHRMQMEEALKHIQKIDMNEIREQILKNQQEITKSIDWEAIQKEMKRAQEEIAKMDLGMIHFEEQERFEKIDKEKVLKEMETELKKLEGLELEKK
jgi:beta-lactamase regulating signal transducer with metallopeptidase domain